MLRSVLRVSIVLPWLLLSALNAAHAEPLPYSNTLALGNPAHPVSLSVEGGSELTLTVASKRRKLPLRTASEVTIEIVKVSATGAVAILRGKSADGPWLGVLGGRSGSEVLLFESAAPSGDPGERRTRELRLDQGGESQASTLRTGTTREGVSLCGRPFLFDAKRLDPASLTLVADGAALASAGDSAKLAALPKAGPAPALAGLSAVSSSEIDPATQLPRAPRVLFDGDANSSFRLRAGGVAVLRWDSSVLPIERLELDLAGSPKPIELALYGEGDRLVRASVPAHAAPTSYELVPPSPLTGRCVALAVLAGEGAAPSLELQELRAYSELDRGPAGSERLIGLLVQDDVRGAEAAEVLAKLGPAAAQQLRARWSELPARGKRRGLKVLARGLDAEAVRALVVELARGDDRELRDAAVQLLDRGGEPGRVALRALALHADAGGDAAARILAGHAEELPHLLAAMAAPGGSERAALRAALQLAARHDKASFRASVTTWLRASPTVAAIAGLSQAIATVDGELAETLVAEHAAAAQSFEERHRFAIALAATAPGGAASSADGWLAREAEGASEWMQRRAALESLAYRKAAALPQVAGKLAQDSYPRVRAAALSPLIASAQREPVEQALKSDGWPLVRADAARALAASAETRPALEAALGDRSPVVRRAVIEALIVQRQPASWPAIAERLQASNEALVVREAAIAYARELCVSDARSALLATARLLLAPNTSEEEARLAVEAVRALNALGGESKQAGAQLVQEAKTPELEALWKRLPAPACEVHHQS